MEHHICIDFEGEGRRGGVSPLPHLLGALVPNPEGGKEYRLYLFREELEPLSRAHGVTGRPELRRVCSLLEAVQELVELARQLDCRLVGYSQHESKIVSQHLASHPAAVSAFQERWYNVKLRAQALLRRRGGDPGDRTLDTLLAGLRPGHKSPPQPVCGAAEACRRLTRAGARSSRWGRWSASHRELAKELVLYNRGDCLAVWKLLNQVMSNYGEEQLR